MTAGLIIGGLGIALGIALAIWAFVERSKRAAVEMDLVKTRVQVAISERLINDMTDAHLAAETILHDQVKARDAQIAVLREENKQLSTIAEAVATQTPEEIEDALNAEMERPIDAK